MKLEWIPVTKDLPVIPKGCDKIFILIAEFDNLWNELHPEDDSYMISEGFYDGEFKGFHFNKYKNNFRAVGTFGHVTHWMYKPEPPTK
jgi:hypothetical protein